MVEHRPVPRLPTYRSDVAASTDELARAGEAAAVAELITARTARPPLAVGLFGDWGQGKSHFLELLQKQVEETAQPDNPLAHSAVRQVRFNAWHYAEAGLWASLVAELFAQLAAPMDGDVDGEQRRQSRLTAELVSERRLRERLHAATARRDELHKVLEEPESLWDRLPEEQRAEVRLLAGEGPEKVYAEAARTVAALRGTGRASWRLVRSAPQVAAAVIAVLVVLAGATIAMAWGLPALWGWAATLPGIACAALVVRTTFRFAQASKARANAAWQKAVQFGEQQRRRLQTAADVADAEVTELTRQVQNVTAAGQLAGLVADRAAAGDYRSQLGVMTQIREDFQHMAELLAHAADDSPDTPGPDTDEAGDELPRIDRIILYIDDLDRCPPQRVVEMLEAVHLLLAVDLFVVVVAVDPRWLLRAVSAHYRDLLLDQGQDPSDTEGGEEGSVDPDDEELWRSTPAQYLEKIFQVVLTLPPLDTGGYQRMLHTLVGVRDDLPAPDPQPVASQHNDVLDASSAVRPSTPPVEREALGTGTAVVVGASDEGSAREDGMYGVDLPTARVIERVDPLTLEPDEIALLNLLGPPLLVATPRAVKRLANSYGLLTAIRRDHREADLDEQRASVVDTDTRTSREVGYRPYRAAMVLLATLVAYPSLGPAFFLHLHHTAAAQPGDTWACFRASLTPQRRKSGRWWSVADPNMTPVQAQQWQALLEGLEAAEEAAAERGLHLPEPLSCWGPWVVPVGRLSFPTGRIVSSLERQRPLCSQPEQGSGEGMGAS
ncbi:P-loop NTPase fold protein [Streptomyces sp. NPDC001581]|uniref:P-loop NTPase fold protein n=1 Tax=Streptomyces sp. NPDC001581 TaxID=3154386 RepID=UPI003327E043